MLLWRCPPALLALRRNSLGALRHISSTKWAQQQKKALDAARRDGDGDGKVQMSAAQKGLRSLSLPDRPARVQQPDQYR